MAHGLPDDSDAAAGADPTGGLSHELQEAAIRRRTLAVGTWVLLCFTGVVIVAGAFLGGLFLRGAMDVKVQAPAFESSRTTARPGPVLAIAVRDLARLETTSFHVERVIDLKHTQEAAWGMVQLEDAILLVAAGDVSAGVDLSSLREQDFDADVTGRSVTVTLPQVEVFATRMDNERTYVHSRSTDVFARRQKTLETRARLEAEKQLREAAIAAGIEGRARAGAEQVLQSLLRSLGYERVQVRWQPR